MPESKKYILTDVENNNNKFWYIDLYDNGDVRTTWGRVSADTPQSKLFPGIGIRGFEAKCREKERKGYTELQTIESEKTSTVSVNNSLKDIAVSQIRTSNSEIVNLIKRLAEANVHNILASTTLTYNAVNGLFSTPLGIVTKEAIANARSLLDSIVIRVQASSDLTFYPPEVNQYFRLIPYNFGRKKLDAAAFFRNTATVQEQYNILDSLEASFDQFLDANSAGSTNSPEMSKVFAASLELASTDEYKKVNAFFKSNYNPVHVSARDNLQIKKVYSVEVDHMSENYDKCSIGNEQRLWHGTKVANLISILKSGFMVAPPSTAQIAGKMFGNGIYFSDQSTKSLNYAYGYWHGSYDPNCFMFLCDVKMGKSYVPGDRYGLPKAGYDSTFAKANVSGVLNNEMIVYNSNQIKPVYLVEFGK